MCFFKTFTMKTLKKILIIVAIVMVIPLIVALFVPKDYTVIRSIIIEKPKSEVFEYIKYLKNQNDYSKWASMDPNMKKSFSGTDGTVGFISAWNSEDDNVGAGEQQILKIEEGERIDYELRFIRPFESTQQAYMTTEAMTENRTEVKWGFSGKMNYPMNLMLLLMNFEKMIGDDLQEGLQNLKTIIENK